MDPPQASLKHVHSKTAQSAIRHQGFDNRATLTTDMVNASRSSPEIVYIPRRPPSARLRGIPAPYIRTSLSPDRVLRRRVSSSEDHAAITCADIIVISSDDEADNVSTPPSSSHLVAFEPREIIDLTQLPSSLPPEVRPPSPSDQSDSPEPIDMSFDFDHNDRPDTMPICTYEVSSNDRPPWIRAGMGQLYSNHPDVCCKIRCTSRNPLSEFKNPRSWFIKCQECGEEKMITIRAGPGFTIKNFIRHVGSVHPHLRSVVEGAAL